MTTETQPLVESTLDIEGMTCASCVNRVQKALSRVDGVESASVNLANETASVAYDPAVIDATALTAAVERAGYAGTVRQVEAPAADHPAADDSAPATDPIDEPTPAATWRSAGCGGGGRSRSPSAWR